jgi:hypothetical protein
VNTPAPGPHGGVRPGPEPVPPAPDRAGFPGPSTRERPACRRSPVPAVPSGPVVLEEES